MNKYAVEGVVGEGAYGVVLKCRNKVTNEIVAVKKFKECEEDDVVRKTTLREVKILRMLKNPCVVDLREAFRRKGKLYLVFEYMENNLLEVLEENPNGLDPETVRRYVFQLCLAIEFCHRHGVIHRDIKPENLLVNPKGQLKLCDFGFARTVTAADVGNLTDYVATRWYRSPELLLGTTDYNFRIDVWAIGCIMAELLDGQPLFPGDSELDQLYVIQKTLGPLPPSQMDAFHKNARFAGMKFPEIRKADTFTKRFGRILSKKGLGFMRSVVQLEPDRRLSSRECVNHPYFEGLKEEFGVVEDFKESRPKSAAISQPAPSAPSVVVPPVAATVKAPVSPRHAPAPTKSSADPVDSSPAPDDAALRTGRKGTTKSLKISEAAKKVDASGAGPSPSATPVGRGAVASKHDPVKLMPSTTTATASTVAPASKHIESQAGTSKRNRLGSRAISVEDDKAENRSSSRDPPGPSKAAGGSLRKMPTDKKEPPATKTRGAQVPVTRTSVVAPTTTYSSTTYTALPTGAPEPYEAVQRPGRPRDDAVVSYDDFPIPVAAAAHIHAAAARAVGGIGASDDADFDVVEHYMSTRPTSGIRPRSGVRSTAVNPALAVVRGGVGPSSGVGLGYAVTKRSPMASGGHDDDGYDARTSSKLSEDDGGPRALQQPSGGGVVSHSRRRHQSRGADLPPDPATALPAVGAPPSTHAAALIADAERQAKLASSDADPPVPAPAPKVEKVFKQSGFYVSPIPAYRK